MTSQLLIFRIINGRNNTIQHKSSISMQGTSQGSPYIIAAKNFTILHHQIILPPITRVPDQPTNISTGTNNHRAFYPAPSCPLVIIPQLPTTKNASYFANARYIRIFHAELLIINVIATVPRGIMARNSTRIITGSGDCYSLCRGI